MKRVKSPEFPFMIIRLWPHHHQNAADFSELIGALKRNSKACDEVWFCTEIGFPPMAAHEHSAGLMAKAAERIRELGIKPGLQIANTIGHGGLSVLQEDSGAAWLPMIDASGRSNPPTPCPRSHAALGYIDRMTRVYASWQPSSIWIDDDLRMNAVGGLAQGCFCRECVKQFSREQGKSYNRRSLVAALHNPTDGTVRLAWTKFNGLSLAGIAKVIAKATHQVAPECRLGFQQIGHEPFLYSGPDWSPVLKSLAQHSHHAAGARLGHGYYADHSPRQMIDKAFLISRQISRLPACVDQICPEIEGYTHNAFGKSAHGLAVESSLDLAMGCNSLSYAILCSGHEPMAWYETLLSRLTRYRPFWEELVKINSGTMPGGLDMHLGKNHVARPLLPQEPPFGWGKVNLESLHNLACLGLPLCTSTIKGREAVILHADAVDGLADKELRRILSGGVMMDGLAAWRVQQRGLGKWLGVEVAPVSGAVPFNERISADTLNGIYIGLKWNGGWGKTGIYTLKPLSPKVRGLGHYEDRLGKHHGMTTSLAENRAGGRVAVFGYYSWFSAPSGAKRNQYLAAADWITRGKLPVLIQTTAPVMVVPRVDAQGRLVSIFLLNACIDASPSLELRLRGAGAATTARWLLPEGRNEHLTLVKGGGDKLLKTPPMAAWSVACVVL